MIILSPFSFKNLQFVLWSWKFPCNTPWFIVCSFFMSLFEMYYFSMSLACLWLNWYTTKTQIYQNLGENSATSLIFKFIPDSIMSSKPIPAETWTSVRAFDSKDIQGFHMWLLRRVCPALRMDPCPDFPYVRCLPFLFLPAGAEIASWQDWARFAWWASLCQEEKRPHNPWFVSNDNL